MTRPPATALSPSDVALLLEPGSIALVGVSAKEGGGYKVGGRAVLHHLLTYGFPGELYPVHPTAAEIEGVRAYPSLEALPATPDCVVLAVPSGAVLGLLEECGARGIRRALLITAGFAELGEAGAALEGQVLARARELGIRLVGPNSTGLVSVAGNVAMSQTSVLTSGDPITPGGLAIMAQSGAISSSVVERANQARAGISHIASIGNQSDLGAADFLAYFAADEHVRAVAMYLESIPDGPAMAEGLRACRAADKPVVALIGGRSVVGEKAASTHTGKMLGRVELELALLRSQGVIIVDDLDDLWRLGSLLAQGTRIDEVDAWAVCTFSGGMGVLTADQLTEAGARLATFTPATVERLRAGLPGYAIPINPLDIGPGPMPDGFRDLLLTVVDDEHVGGICVPLPMGGSGWHQGLVDGILAAVERGKPVLVGWYGGAVAEHHIRVLREAGVMAVETPSDLGRLVGAVTATRATGAPGEDAPAPAPAPAPVLGGFEALRTVQRAGVAVAPMQWCEDAAAAVAAAEELGYPVAVKSADERISHRIELDLVRIGLQGADEVRAAADDLVKRTAAGLIVQAMAGNGRELVLVVRDAGRLGTFAGLGLGGSAVEALGELAYVPLPCDVADLRAAVARLRGHELLLGHRGQEPVDLTWVAATLSRLGARLESDQLGEIEINPAFVGADGGIVVDALITPSAKGAGA